MDCGSMDCFIDTTIVAKYSLLVQLTMPMALQLFNRMSNMIITHAVKLTLSFPSDNITSDVFYVTLLDSFCSLTLEHSWLF